MSKTQVSTSNNPIAYVPKSEVKKPKSKRWIIKLAFALITLASLTLNYGLLKKHYVIRCAEGGMLMAKETCDKFAQKSMDLIDAKRVEMVINNPDLFGEEIESN